METFDEILFEKRNKSYGAYVLRKKYDKYVLISFMIGLFVLGSLLAYPVIASYVNKTHSIKDADKEISIEMLKPPTEEFIPPPPVELEKVVAPKFIAPIVVEEDVDNSMGTQDELSTKTNEAPVVDNEITIVEKPVQVIEPPVQKEEIFMVVEEQPTLDGLYEFLSSHIKYPEEAKELGIQGKVFVTFVVEKDGSITEVKVLRGIGGGCDEEAVRVVKSMPKWNPGKQRGTPVRVQFNIPVKFTLN